MSGESIEDLYTDHILDHYECPYHKGPLPDATHVHAGKNPLCGDRVQLQIRLGGDGRIEQAWFDGTGCAISQAAASILCEEIEGRNVDDVRELPPQHMLDLLKVPLTATRQKCGLLAFKVLKTMIYSLGAAGDTPSEPAREQHGGN